MTSFRPLQSRLALCGVGALSVIVWLWALGTRSLISSDEGRYATLALHVLQSGEWITPRLNGLLYFEKPPLGYWFGAVSMALFGVNEFAARLWPGLAGLGTVVLVGYTAKRLWGPRSGVHALLIAGACTWINVNSHFLTLDAGLCAAVTLCLCGVLIAEHAGFQSREGARWMIAAWLGIALGVLSKGPVALVIPLGTLIVQSLWRRDRAIWAQLHWVAGLCILAVVTVPWFVLVSIRNPDFAWFFFIHEHLARYVTTVHKREGSWWYYMPILLAGTLPWTAALPWLLRPRRNDFAGSLLIVWVAFIFVFFSISESKLPSYILPIFPAIALLAARAFAQATPRALAWFLTLPVVTWLVAVALMFHAEQFFAVTTPASAIQAMQRGVALGGAIFLVAAGAGFVLLRRGRKTAALTLVALSHGLATLIVMQSHDAFGQLKSSRTIAQTLRPLVGEGAPIFAVRDYEHTLPFYLQRPVTLVDYRDEFAFGEDHEPARWLPTLDEFVSQWIRPGQAAAYMQRPTFEALRARGLPMRIVFEDPRRLVVVKQ